jgi:D-alanyl-D-alanine carboxypeptidase
MNGRSALRKIVGRGADRPAAALWTSFATAIALVLAVLVLAISVTLQSAEARQHPRSVARSSGYSTLVIDAESGQLLEADNADEPHFPASLTKMMTAYLTFEALQHGRLRLPQSIPVSSFAASQDPTKLDLEPGQNISVEQAMLGLAVRSANDAAVVLAEAMGGSEENFAQMMTRKARQLGMNNTIFRNASGLPDPEQVTTARDMATLAAALIRDYPQYYHFFNVREFDFEGTLIPTHNHVLEHFEGADGLKTGFTRAAGWNIVISAVRNGRRLIGVVLGGRTAGARDHEVIQLLTVAFAARQPMRIIASNPAPVPAATVQAAAVAQAVATQPGAATPRLQLPVLNSSIPQPVVPTQIVSPVAAQRPAAQIAAAPVALAPPPAPVQTTPVTPAGETPGLRQAMDQLEARSETDSGSTTRRAQPGAQDWSIQLGAYGRYNLAHETALRVAHSMPMLATSSIAIGKIRLGSSTGYRARLVGLSERQARIACSTLARRHAGCIVIAPSVDSSVAEAMH